MKTARRLVRKIGAQGIQSAVHAVAGGHRLACNSSVVVGEAAKLSLVNARGRIEIADDADLCPNCRRILSKEPLT